jgi:hypothetical protein
MSTSHKRQQAVARWTRLLRQRFPTFSQPQAKGLALWSIGLVLARAASLHAIAFALALWINLNPLNLYKRLQEWYLEATAKKGHGTGGTGYQRRDWSPRACAPDLLRWILERWPDRQLVLALDPTNFGERFTVLAVSVLYRSCAVPVMWTVVTGGESEAWEPHWERMLTELAKVVGGGWQVLVLTDRGMYSPRLFRCLVNLDWHPFLRIRAQGFYRRDGGRKWLPLEDLRVPKGKAWAWPADVFKNDAGRLHCTLVCYQGEGYQEPWLIVTDLKPGLARASWYGLRGWIEQGFKRVKGEGWKLPRTRIRDAGRLERVWLAVAVGTLWVLEVGGADEVDRPSARGSGAGRKVVGTDTPGLPDLRGEPGEGGARPPAPRRRIWSVFTRGWQLLRNALAVGVLLLGCWHPEAWPEHPVAGLPPTREVAAARGDGPGQGPTTSQQSTPNPRSHIVDSS